MVLVTYIREVYGKFIEEKKSEGCCFGFCLTWLGDILKERAKEEHWWLTPERKAALPSSPARLEQFLERAFRRHVNYIKNFGEILSNPSAGKNKYKIYFDYKNLSQIEKEKITGVPGLQYKAIIRKDFTLFNGLHFFSSDRPLCGVIITFGFTESSGSKGYHAVAAFRYSASETFFLDPTFGLFKISSENPMSKIIYYFSNVYKDAEPCYEIIISKKTPKSDML